MSWLKMRTRAHLLSWVIFLLAAGSLSLMLYALVWEAGNIINLPNKRIGFYNFCLWNQTAGEVQCLQVQDLRELGVGQVELVMARLCVYTAQVLCLFSPYFILQTQCTNDRKAWEVVLVVLGLSVTLLAGGLSLFLFQTWVWIHLSELSAGFLALAGAQALLVLQLFAAATHLLRLQGAQVKGNPAPEKHAPPFQV
ncbi:transmembrane protein 140 [Carettochelys insculpta]|uniref:transmembrane protein 140 n=1 Tax=Carettochelys insculpta TaxID=44489 RepID=UPI003EB88DED